MTTAHQRLVRLLALALALVACSGAPAGPPARGSESASPAGPPPVGDAFFEARGRSLGLSAAQAKARDAALSESEPPEGLDVEMTAQAAALWGTLCAGCHGATGRLEGVAPAPAGAPTPRVFGTTGMAMGFFFGGDKMRAGLYRKIARGEPPAQTPLPSPMPKWGGTLAREQIWALIAHIESL